MSTGSPNVIMAMARIALFLNKSAGLLDEAEKKEPERVTLRTVEASELDVQAIHTLCVELVRLRDFERMIKGVG